MEVDAEAKYTLYVRNLNERVKLPELRRSLYEVFGQHGVVLRVTAQHCLKMRGQAFVVFEQPMEAARAIEALQGTVFFGKPMVVDFAKHNSKLDRVKPKGETPAERPQPAVQPPTHSAAATVQVPHRVLFVENLAEDTPEEEITAAFQQFTGFQEVRLVPSRRGIAFIEFVDEFTAGVARSAMHDHALPSGASMKVSFAKK